MSAKLIAAMEMRFTCKKQPRIEWIRKLLVRAKKAAHAFVPRPRFRFQSYTAG